MTNKIGIEWRSGSNKRPTQRAHRSGTEVSMIRMRRDKIGLAQEGTNTDPTNMSQPLAEAKDLPIMRILVLGRFDGHGIHPSEAGTAEAVLSLRRTGGRFHKALRR